jgi:hypothetical protein
MNIDFSKLNTIFYHIGPFEKFLFNIFSVEIDPDINIKKMLV